MRDTGGSAPRLAGSGVHLLPPLCRSSLFAIQANGAAVRDVSSAAAAGCARQGREVRNMRSTINTTSHATRAKVSAISWRARPR